MKKTLLALVAIFFLWSSLLAQATSSNPSTPPSGKINAVSFGINLPVGDFAITHSLGLGLSYAWSNHRFGQLKKLPEKCIGFTAEGGVVYYFGKSETVANNDYTNGGYTYLHAFGGILYNPCKNGFVSLTTGPTLGVYKTAADVGFGTSLSGSYYFDPQIAITPGLLYMKHKEANALWAPFLKVSYAF